MLGELFFGWVVYVGSAGLVFGLGFLVQKSRKNSRKRRETHHDEG
jgi:hypothetical protein